MRRPKKVQAPARLMAQEVKLQRLQFKSNEIALAEYDFGPVPKDEEDACYVYEYARESSSIIQSVRNLRKSVPASSSPEEYSFLQEADLTTSTSKELRAKIAKSDVMVVPEGPVGRMDIAIAGKIPSGFIRAAPPSATEMKAESNNWVVAALASILGFPEAPWQTLPEAQRSFLKGYKDEIFWFVRDDPPLVLQISSAMDQNSISEWRQRTKWMRNDNTVKRGFFRVSGNYSAKELSKLFKTFVSKELPDCPSDGEGRPGRRAVRDALNALGAMRLRFCCRTFPEAKARMKPGEKGAGQRTGLFYGQRRSMDNAIERAVSDFHTLLGLKETESPIHYSRGWLKPGKARPAP